MNAKQNLWMRGFMGVIAVAVIANFALFCGCLLPKSHPAFVPPPPEPVLVKAAAEPSAPFEGAGWKSLYDGKTLKGWKVTDFYGHGAVSCKSGLIVIETGAELNGLNWTNEAPATMNYEVALDAMKLDGSDFFCGLTFPVATNYCSLILGGWGGGIVGLSSLDGEDASENDTSTSMDFDNHRWYRVRVRVTEAKIECWLDDKKIINAKIKGRRVGLRFGEIDNSIPFGIATYQTRAAIREIKIRPLPPQ